MIKPGTKITGTKKQEALSRKGAQRLIDDPAATLEQVDRAVTALNDLDKRREKKTAEKLSEVSQQLAEKTQQLEEAQPRLARLARVEQENAELKTQVGEASAERDRLRAMVVDLLDKENPKGLDLVPLVAIAKEQAADKEVKKINDGESQ